MEWKELKIYTTHEGVEPLTNALISFGIDGFVINDPEDIKEFERNKNASWDYIGEEVWQMCGKDTYITVYVPDSEDGINMLEAVRSAVNALKAAENADMYGTLEIRSGNIKEEDWANNWKQYFKPLNVGNRLVIKPSWEQLGADNDRVVLELDPENSFGTGRHHTTRLCLELVEKYVKDGDRVCDLGCGSGIISIAAVLLGAKSAVAVDISPDAAVTAKANANKNGISDDCYTAYCGDVVMDGALREKIGNGYELVAANIVADVLLAMADVFKCVTAKGGTLVLSGIITGRCDEVFDAMRQRDFEMLETTECEMWNAAAFKKL